MNTTRELLEQLAVDADEAFSDSTYKTSIAISLKRIADSLEKLLAERPEGK